MPELAELSQDITATTDRIMALSSFDLKDPKEVYETVDSLWHMAKDVIPEEDLKAITRPILQEVLDNRFVNP